MYFITALVLYGILQAATPVLAGCAADNCLRAVRASAFTTRHGTADCSSYFMVTVTPVTNTLTVTNGVITTTTVQVSQATVSPTSIPSYASACSGSVRYSSACSCVGVTQMTTTIAASTPTGTPTGGYVIVSPSSCPPSTPTGAVIGQSDSTFSANNAGLQYQQYANSQFIIQNASSGPFFVDLSSPTSVTISDADGDTLIINADGTFEAFAGSCEIELVGSLLAPSSKSKAKRNALELRQSAELCNDVQLFCNSRIGVFLEGAVGGALCLFLGGEIGADIGGGIGFLGNVLGPEVGIPTTLLGVVLGGRLGAFLASKIGATLCSGATSLLADQLCKACPSPVTCGAGTISCNGGACQDALSDPNNCGACGRVCPSGTCQNGQCSTSTCDGSTCGSLNSCGADCFCFETSDSTGFCGPDIACAPLADCFASLDCPQGQVCATSTCCGRDVCLGSCAIDVRRSVLFGRNFTELYTGGEKWA